MTLIVAHRLASLMHADRILVLDQGRIVEQGSHKDLIKLGGAYSKLNKIQLDSNIFEAGEK